MGFIFRGARRLAFGEPAAGRVERPAFRLFARSAICLALAGCATEPVPIPTGLAPPAADLMARCPALPDIPADEGNPETRRRYYASTRQSYGQCADRVAGLQSYARTVSPPTQPAAGSPQASRGLPRKE